MLIDTDFKMFSDTPENKDPDTYSRTLCSYHLYLWNKPLPNGKVFSLTSAKKAPYYLTHTSDMGEFILTSDSITHTYSRRHKNAPITKIVRETEPSDIDNFYNLASTIGAYIVFPANKIEGKPTINAIRGMHRLIDDRFDFTLECIRRWYCNIESPLSIHLNRYGDFFRLFCNFQGYYRFFLLDDLIESDMESIRFWLPFTDFGKTKPLPNNKDEYLMYMKNVIAFITARNKRISTFSQYTPQTLTDDEFAAAAAGFDWTYAKTMPQCPHEYIVRGKTADDETYFAMFRTIEARGKWGKWNDTPRQYLHPKDGYYYWKMTDDIQESIIINRAKEG